MAAADKAIEAGTSTARSTTTVKRPVGKKCNDDQSYHNEEENLGCSLDWVSRQVVEQSMAANEQPEEFVEIATYNTTYLMGQDVCSSGSWSQIPLSFNVRPRCCFGFKLIQPEVGLRPLTPT